MALSDQSTETVQPVAESALRRHYERVVRRLVYLQDISASLAAARTLGEIASTIIDQGMPALDAEVGVVALLSDDGARLRNIGFKGVPAETEEAWAEYPVDSPVPVAEAARRGTPVVVPTREERNARYPVLAQVHGVEHGGAVVAFPMVVAQRTLGTLGFCFPESRAFDADDHAFVASIAQQCALAIERVRWREVAEQEIAQRTASEAALQDRGRQLAALIANLPGMVYRGKLTRERALSFASAQAVEMTGYSAEEFVSRAVSYGDVIAPEDRDEVWEAVQSAIAVRGPYALVYRVVSRAGPTRWVFDKGAAVYDDAGAPVALEGLVTDVTELKRTQDALREAGQRKDEFLAMLAHELRNPLAPIANAVQLMGAASPSSEVLSRARTMIERQVQHMVRLVDDLLDISRISRGKITLATAPVDLVELARATVDDYRPILEGRGLRVELALPSEPVVLHADATRVAQAIGNLLQNAGKFTDSPGAVRLSLAVDRGSREVALSVADTGIGMEPAMLTRVFEPFAQADTSLDRSRGGLGLGLALVKGVVELHGGRAHATSEGAGRGSVITVTLPLAPVLASSNASSEREPAGATTAVSGSEKQTAREGAPRHVLIIEDNADAAESLRMLLELSGHTVSVAHTGVDGVAAARRAPPDVIICDIGLPGGLDGYAVARALRAESSLTQTFFIALTGYGQAEDRRRARAAGFHAHLTKPVALATLERLLAAPSPG